MIDFSVEKNFQLVLELWNITLDMEDLGNGGSSSSYYYADNSEIIAIDSVKITYGPCSLLKNNE